MFHIIFLFRNLQDEVFNKNVYKSTETTKCAFLRWKKNETVHRLLYSLDILFFLGKKSITLWCCFGIVEEGFGGFYAMDRSFALGEREFAYP